MYTYIQTGVQKKGQKMTNLLVLFLLYFISVLMQKNLPCTMSLLSRSFFYSLTPRNVPAVSSHCPPPNIPVFLREREGERHPHTQPIQT